MSKLNCSNIGGIVSSPMVLAGIASSGEIGMAENPLTSRTRVDGNEMNVLVVEIPRFVRVCRVR